MSMAIAMATFRHHVEFLDQTHSFSDEFEDVWPIVGGSLAILIVIIYIIWTIHTCIRGQTKAKKLEMPVAGAVGLIFGLGLAMSGMCRRSTILGFLTIYEDWDPSLMFVMGGAVCVNAITFPLIIYKQKEPIYAQKLCIPENKSIDLKLLAGASMFGLGWGLSGMCPGPAMINFFNLTHCLVFLPFVALGHYIVDFTDYVKSQRRNKTQDSGDSILDSSSKMHK